MTRTERQYRRVLRLLPAGYRRLWEEDMVSAYLDSVGDSPRRTAGELLSVVWLALRLRLNGSRATPRAELWYLTVLGLALLTTLYESLRTTLTVANLVGGTVNVNVVLRWPDHVAYWWEVLSLVWVATFFCLVLGRLVAARVLVIVAVAYEFGLTAWIVAHAIRSSWWALPPYEASTMHQAWLGLTAVAVFLVPRDLRPHRSWLAAYLVPAAVIVPIGAISADYIVRQIATSVAYQPPPEWLQRLQLLNVGTLLHVGVIVGMAIALTWARRWLLPLAAFGGAVATVQLLGYDYGNDLIHGYGLRETTFWTWINVVQLVLAVACAMAGVVVVRRARLAGGRSDASGHRGPLG